MAGVNPALLPDLPVQGQPAAVVGAAVGAPAAEADVDAADDDQPDPDAAAHDAQVELEQPAEEVAPPVDDTADHPAEGDTAVEDPPEARTSSRWRQRRSGFCRRRILPAALDEEGGQAAAEGLIQEEGAALGAPGAGDAREEEAPEEDEFVEVEGHFRSTNRFHPWNEDNSVGAASSAAAPALHTPAPVGSGSLSSRTSGT